MKYRVTHDGLTKTYAALHHTASHLLKTATTHEEGATLTLRAAAVFYAFAFEAYLNHVGQEEIEIWEEIERIPHASKLRILAKHLQMPLDYGGPPFQLIGELFALRDMLAHGRTRQIAVHYETNEEPPHFSSWRIHEWEKLTIEKVEAYASCVVQAVESINRSRAHPDEMLWNQGVRGRTVELIEDTGRTRASHTAMPKPRQS